MSAEVIRFPLRSVARAVFICKESSEGGWLVLHGSSGWTHGTHSDAIKDAVWAAHNSGLHRIVIRWGRA